jgi:SAM-dependent methyltransferase
MHAMVAECPACRLAFQTPRPSREAGVAYMNWRWRSSDEYVGDQASQLRRAMRQLGHVRRYMPRPGRLLDFGAGAGAFVRAAREHGWEADGIEHSDSAIARAKEFHGVELRRELGEEQYDVLTMWDVVEHLHDPIAILRMIGEHMAEGGLAFIETGNWESWHRISRKDRWQLYLFDHQYYFTPSSLEQVLARAGFGDASVLDCNRQHPFTVRRVIRRPFYLPASWRAWRTVKALWPEHGDIEVMIVVARKMA